MNEITFLTRQSNFFLSLSPYASGEVTSQGLWSRYDRHFVGMKIEEFTLAAPLMPLTLNDLESHVLYLSRVLVLCKVKYVQKTQTRDKSRVQPRYHLHV